MPKGSIRELDSVSYRQALYRGAGRSKGRFTPKDGGGELDDSPDHPSCEQRIAAPLSAALTAERLSGGSWTADRGRV